MASSVVARLRAGGLVAVSALTLGGCQIQTNGSSGGQQVPQEAYYPSPTNGQFLCLASIPGTPILEHPGSVNAVMGYTRNVVAFSGLQEGRWISVQTYTGLLGWLDGTTIKPFQTANPGHTCIVTIDAAQHPIFAIN